MVLVNEMMHFELALEFIVHLIREHRERDFVDVLQLATLAFFLGIGELGVEYLLGLCTFDFKVLLLDLFFVMLGTDLAFIHVVLENDVTVIDLVQRHRLLLVTIGLFISVFMLKNRKTIALEVVRSLA